MKLLLLARIQPRSEAHIPRPWHNSKFDESTGQVYTESTTAIQSSDDRNWTQWHQNIAVPALDDAYDTKGKVDHYQDPNCRSARSLQATAIRCILQNLSDITIELIERLPIHLVRRIWDGVIRTTVISFNTWSIFSKVLRHDMPRPYLLNYSRTIKNPKSPLRIYTAPLSSKPLEFMTSLSITTHFSIPDLVRLSDIPNLSILEIINLSNSESAFGVGDRLIRAWSLAASNDGTFSVLRILRLWNYENLTSQSLAFLNSFPALALYDVAGCGFTLNTKLQARQLGWTPIVETDVTGVLKDACIERILLMQDRLGVEAEPLQTVDAQQSNGQANMIFIPRAEVPRFLIKTNLSTLPQSSGQPCDLSGTTDKIRIKKPGRWNRSSGTFNDSQPSSRATVHTWEDLMYKIFPRLGELRNDADLLRAGVDIGDQAVMGGRLVNSVPMAALRLGSPYSTTTTLRPLSFIRINLPSTANAATKVDGCDAVENVTKDLHNTKRKGQVMRGKKRKLDDLLDSFL